MISCLVVWSIQLLGLNNFYVLYNLVICWRNMLYLGHWFTVLDCIRFNFNHLSLCMIMEINIAENGSIIKCLMLIRHLSGEYHVIIDSNVSGGYYWLRNHNSLHFTYCVWKYLLWYYIQCVKDLTAFFIYYWAHHEVLCCALYQFLYGSIIFCVDYGDAYKNYIKYGALAYIFF